LGCGRQTTSFLLQEVFFFNLKLKLFGSTSIAGGLLADTNKKLLYSPEKGIQQFFG